MSDEATENGLYRDGTQPVVSPDGSRLLPRRPGRELFPVSWVRRRAVLTYHDGAKPQDLKCSILETCGVGLVVAANDGTKTLIGWDRFVRLELLES